MLRVGYAYVLGWLVSLIAYGISLVHYFLSAYRVATLLRGALMKAVYEKALRLHLDSVQQSGPGALASHMTVDIQVSPRALLWSTTID